ncbi:MAG: GNAT family N-acetyltransferase, partial [Cyanobacteria bacterium J06631_9]
NISIGAIIFGHHVDSGETEVSYLLLPEQTGKGYAQEAVQTALKRVKGKMVVAETQARNMRSRRLLERLGFEEAERLKRFGEQQVYYERRLSDNQSQ